MQRLQYLSWLPLLLVLLVGGCDQLPDILTPSEPQPPDLSVSPNGGPYIPPAISPNEQVMLMAQQGLSAGDGTTHLATLKSLDRLIARVGESAPPGSILAAPPRAGLQGRLSPQRALELSRLTPITQLGSIQTSVDAIQFTGSAQLDRATQQVKATLDANSTAGTRLKISQTYSRNPADFTYQLTVTGTLVYQGKALNYDIMANYDRDGNGAAEVRIVETGSSLAYHTKLLVRNRLTIEGAEAVTGADGFWTVTDFNAALNDLDGSIEKGDFTLKASNGFTGKFNMQTGGTVANASKQIIAQLGVSPMGALLVNYADGSAPSIIQL